MFDHRGGRRAWLVRHGQSESNAGLPVAGLGTAPLTPLGHQQAEHVADAFTEPPVLIVSSAFRRARQTARPTRERFPDVPYEEWPVEEFSYLGRLYTARSTNAERRPATIEYWARCDPAYAEGGDGETFERLIARTREFTERFARCPDGLVAVFTHGLFMRALMWSLSTGVTEPDAADMAAFRTFLQVWSIPNGAIVGLHADGGTPQGLCLVGGSFTHLSAGTATVQPDSPGPADRPGAPVDLGPG